MSAGDSPHDLIALAGSLEPFAGYFNHAGAPRLVVVVSPT